MNHRVPRFIRELRPLDMLHHAGLQAVRLARASVRDIPPTRQQSARAPMAPLAAALASGAAVVSELGDGDVGRLSVHNRGGALLFGMAGELVVGGRQDRVLNSSVLIAPGAAAPVSVSCVERHRWEPGGANRSFSAAPAAASASPAVRSAVHGTMVSNLTRTGQRRTNQREIWRKVSQTLRRTGTHASVPTCTLAGGMSHQAHQLDAYATACAAVDPGGNQLGLALFTPGTPSAGFHGFTSIDCFASPALLQHYAPRLVRGAALEAAAGGEVASPASALVPPPDATRLLLAALADQRPVTTTPAAGEAPDACEHHYCFDGIVASVLCHEHRPVHLSISPLEEPAAQGPGPVPGDPCFPPGAGNGQAPHRATNCQTIGAQQAMFCIPDLGPGNQSRFVRLPYGSYTIGRSSQCDVQLTDDVVSRTHARLDIGEARITVRDLDSTNGVLVNDEPILFVDLQPGDRVTLGRGVELQLLSKGE